MENVFPMRLAIHGSCVSRDIFEMVAEQNILICEYIARNSIVASVFPPANILPESKENENWRERMVRIDCSKTLFDRLRKANADYILIDLIDERFSLNKVGDSFITWSGGAKEYLENIPEDLIHASKISKDMLRQYVKKYCERLLSIFSPTQIILYRARFLNRYIDLNGDIVDFPAEKMLYYNILNNHISFLYDEMEKILNCRVIQLPVEALASEDNKWGLAPMHYCRENYTEVLKQIQEILGVVTE